MASFKKNAGRRCLELGRIAAAFRTEATKARPFVRSRTWPAVSSEIDGMVAL